MHSAPVASRNQHMEPVPPGQSAATGGEMSGLLIEVEPELERQIRERAEREGLSISELVRLALEDLLTTGTANPALGREAVNDADGGAGTGPGERRPIWEIGAALLRDVP